MEHEEERGNSTIDEEIIQSAALRRQTRTRLVFKIWLVLAILLCIGNLYSYANFRSVKGESFFNAIKSSPVVLSLGTENTWGFEAYEDIFSNGSQSAPYYIGTTYVYCWGSDVGSAMQQYHKSVPKASYFTIVHLKTMLSIYVTKSISLMAETDAKKSTELLKSAIERLSSEPTLTWPASVAAQLRHLGFLVWWMLGFFIPEFLFQAPLLLLCVAKLPALFPLFLLIFSPSWLAIPVFCLFLAMSALYVLLPPGAWKWMKDVAAGNSSGREKTMLVVGTVAVLLVASVGSCLISHVTTPSGNTAVVQPDLGLVEGKDMSTLVKEGRAPYMENIPDFVLTGTGTYTKDFSATVKIRSVEDSRTVWGQITSLSDLVPESGTYNTVRIYLCQPLSSHTESLDDGSIAYTGDGYPDIIEGRSYDITAVLQEQWKEWPFVYVPTAADVRKTTQQTTVSAEDALKEFFKYWNEKNLLEMEKRISPDRTPLQWRLDELNYVKVISIVEREPTEDGTKAFVVVLDINYVKSHGKMIGWENGEVAYNFSLKRITDTSPWLVAGIWRGDP
jgi:hypothetical protein